MIGSEVGGGDVKEEGFIYVGGAEGEDTLLLLPDISSIRWAKDFALASIRSKISFRERVADWSWEKQIVKCAR